MKLKWLSYPVFVYSLYLLCKGIYNILMCGTVDIGWVYLSVGIQSVTYALGYGLLGGLVYLAFKDRKINVT